MEYFNMCSRNSITIFPVVTNLMMDIYASNKGDI